METDVVLFATGRRARTEGLGCEGAGVLLDPSGAVLVDDAFRTSVPRSLFGV